MVEFVDGHLLRWELCFFNNSLALMLYCIMRIPRYPILLIVVLRYLSLSDYPVKQRFYVPVE